MIENTNNSLYTGMHHPQNQMHGIKTGRGATQWEEDEGIQGEGQGETREGEGEW